VEAIVPTVAEALGFSFYTGAVGGTEGEPQQQLPAKQQLLNYVRQKTMLLIMDNFEHLLDGGGLVTEILKTAPDVKILTTSRARLNVQGEHLFPIAGMHFPDREIAEDTTRYSAVKLFLSSVRRTQPRFEPTADNLTDVVQICRLVEGMPLGIELAAGLVQMLTPAEIATEISQSLDVLETELRDVPERQRSMRAAFDHSRNLLTEREREVFQRLSVFRGGFTRQAAQEVTGASLRELMALVNKSLLQRMSRGRYEMHELLRDYAAEKLDQTPAAGVAVRDRHSAYYAAALQEWDADLKGARQQAALAEMDVEIENTRTAWNWAVEQGQVERMDQAIDGLCRFYEWRVRYQEGEAACRMAARKLASEKLAATASGEGLRIWAKILTWQSVFSRVLGCTEPASQLLRQSLALLEKPELVGQDTRLEKAFVLAEMGYIAVVSGNREEAGRLYEQSLALYQALGDRYGTALALYALGEVAQHLGVYDQAKQWYEESLAIRQALGDRRGIADSLSSLGLLANFQGRTEEGECLARGSIAIRRELGGQVGIARGLYDLSASLMEFGRYAEARSLLEESVAIFNNLGFREGLARSRSVLSFAKVHLGQYEQARAQALMALTLAREIDYQQAIACSLCWLGCAAGAMGAYAEAQQLLQESVALFREIGQLEELGWSLSALGSMKLALGNFPQARQHFYEALQIAAAIRSFTTLLAVLPPIALMLLVQGEKERAVKLYALASRYPAVANSRLFKDVAGRYIASLPREVKERAVELYALASRYPAVANSRLLKDFFGRLIGAAVATLPPDVVAAAQARGRARDLEATVAELLVELAG
jgi:predicted ATPase